MGRRKLHIDLTTEEEFAIICMRERFWRLRKVDWRTDHMRIGINYHNAFDGYCGEFRQISAKTKNGLWCKKLIRKDWTDAYCVIYVLTDLGEQVKLSKDRLDRNDPLYPHTEYGKMDKFIADHKKKPELKYADYYAVLEKVTKHQPTALLNELHARHRHWNFHKFINHFLPKYYEELSLFYPTEKPANGFEWYPINEYHWKEIALLSCIQLMGFMPKYIAHQKQIQAHLEKIELGKKHRFNFIQKLRRLGIQTIQDVILAYKQHKLNKKELDMAYTLQDPFSANQYILCSAS